MRAPCLLTALLLALSCLPSVRSDCWPSGGLFTRLFRGSTAALESTFLLHPHFEASVTERSCVSRERSRPLAEARRHAVTLASAANFFSICRTFALRELAESKGR